jgi:hypothetical protein
MGRKTENFPPTIFESILVRLRTPYWLSAIIVAVFVGPLGNFLFLFSLSNDMQSALYGTFGLSVAESRVPNIQFNVYLFVSNIIWYAFLFYVAFSARYLRLRLAKAEPFLTTLVPNGKKTVRKAFHVVSKAYPQIIMTIIFLMVYATSVPDLVAKSELTALSTPIYILRSLLRSLMFGSVLWLCCASLWGLYRFGKQQLKLKSYQEDPMLGTGEMGSLSFSFTFVYFLGLALFSTQMILGGLAGSTTIVNLATVTVLVPAGIGLFLAPLVSIHKKMVEAKKSEIASTRKMFSDLIRAPQPYEKDDQHMIKLLTLDAIERKAASIRTWPIESPVLGKITLITISVSATMIARFIQILLNI